MTPPRAALAVLALLAACEDDMDEWQPHFDRAGAFRALATQAQFSATTRYRTAVTNMTEMTCLTAHDTYDLDVGTRVDNMAMLTAELDALIVAEDPATPNHADAACIHAAVRAELDAHDAAACTGATVEDSRAEAMRHIDALVLLTMHATGRMDEIFAGIESERMNPEMGVWTWTLPSRCP